MGNRSYPIYNVIDSCAYASKPYTKGNKSYGVRDHSEIHVKVGSSGTHSNVSTYFAHIWVQYLSYHICRKSITVKHLV